MGASDGAMSGQNDRLEGFFRLMLLIRRFEEKAGQLYGMGMIEGYCHLSIGQEAIAAGARAALSPDDRVIASYRNHAHALASGMAPETLMAELTGRADGACGGYGGSMHVFSKAHGFHGGFAVAASQVAVGAGVALAERQLGRPGVVVCFIGERAAVQGQVSETLLLAAEHRLPMVLVIENNDGEKLQEHVSLKDLGAPFRIIGVTHDGADVSTVHRVVEERVAACRAGAGPALVEFTTVRYRGHSMANPGKYAARVGTRPEAASRDPIDLVRDAMAAAGWAAESLSAIEREVRDRVQAATDQALAAPHPDPAAHWPGPTAQGAA